jgi:hypothetical protein
MLKKAAERLEEKYAEAVRQALSSIDGRRLEEWSRQVLQIESPVRISRPDVLARAGPMIPTGRRRRAQRG